MENDLADNLIHRDLNWLSFNARVLQEAEDESVPLIERLRFLGIFSNNLDEFFKVRYATVKRIVEAGKKGRKALGVYAADELLEKKECVNVDYVDDYGKTFRETIQGKHVNDMHGDEPTTWKKIDKNW